MNVKVEGLTRPRADETPSHEKGDAQPHSSGSTVSNSVVRQEEPPWSNGSERYAYRSTEGDLLFYVDRVDCESGGKIFIPWTIQRNLETDEEAWTRKAPPSPRPLYGLGRLHRAPDQRVLIVEGEKAANAANAAIGATLPVLTSMGGANAAAKSDWSPLAGRDVVIWPDNDEAGQRYAGDVSAELARIEVRSIRIVDVPCHAPKGWDLADPLVDAGLDAASARHLIDEAPEPAPNEEPLALKPLSYGAFVDLDVPPRQLLMEPWLPEKGLVMLYAKRGVGKTHLALAVASTIALGNHLLGWRTPKPRKVCYIDGEMPTQALQERLAALPPTMRKGLDDNLTILCADQHEMGLPDLSRPDGQAALETVIGPAELIVLDNLSTLFRSGFENEADSWGPVQDWLLKLRRMGKTVLLVHHAGKGGQQRGTSRREDVLDTVIKLERPFDYATSQGARFNVVFEKSRGFFGEDAATFEAQFTDGEWRKGDVALDPLVEKALYLQKSGKSQREIADELGTSPATINRRLKSIEEA